MGCERSNFVVVHSRSFQPRLSNFKPILGSDNSSLSHESATGLSKVFRKALTSPWLYLKSSRKARKSEWRSSWRTARRASKMLNPARSVSSCFRSSLFIRSSNNFALLFTDCIKIFPGFFLQWGSDSVIRSVCYCWVANSSISLAGIFWLLPLKRRSSQACFHNLSRISVASAYLSGS